MIYRAIGLMSGSSLDGLDIVFAEFTATGGKWGYEILAAECVPYEPEMLHSLQHATSLTALEYQLLDTSYGHYTGLLVNAFIEKNNLEHQVALIASHGHTTFHLPGKKMTAQLGDGAAIAAATGLPVVSDLRSMDIAFGGQGAPIIPIGEQLLFAEYSCFLNLGGIANISFKENGNTIAFDVCAANRVLNMLAAKEGLSYDNGGTLAASGSMDASLLHQLNALDYYLQNGPKSLPNSFGTDVIFPLIEAAGLSTADALCTYTAHIGEQICTAFPSANEKLTLLVTGGGAFNNFLVEQLTSALLKKNIELVVPSDKLVNFKEALVMALIGVLRWREEYNVLPSATGAVRGSIGGALWLGTEG